MELAYFFKQLPECYMQLHFLLGSLNVFTLKVKTKLCRCLFSEFDLRPVQFVLKNLEKSKSKNKISCR